MYSSIKKFTAHAIHDNITIQRNQYGVPTIYATNREDLCFGIGYAHAWDRLVQMMLVRAIARGRASEYFDGSDELIEVDQFMRWIHFERDVDKEMEKIDPGVKKELDAYCAGINTVLKKKRRPFEFLLVGYTPEPWEPEDSLVTAKVMGYIGLAQSQGDMQKFLIQMIQTGIDEDRLNALFPYLKEKIDYDLLKGIQVETKIVPGHLWNSVLPNLRASNNWVVNGKKTKSGQPILASDPHMEVNRLPALWYEAVLKVNEDTAMGITMPGLPVIVMGRTDRIAWGGTYGFMDMIDYFIEECKDEQFLYDGKWIPFEKRVEIIRPKKREPIGLVFYENHHGVLEGDASKPGKYLSMAFSGRSGAGGEVFNIFMRLHEVKNVKQAQEKFRNITMPTFNWVFADRDGNIGYQMNGKLPKRRKGISGLLPIPGWDSKNDWQGFIEPAELPTCYNPESGYFATANNDLNKFGVVPPINLPMAPYRVQRIMEMLEQNNTIDIDYIKSMHYDLYSKQAERLMTLIKPLLPETENGAILKEWDCVYDENSKGAMLFESVYLNLVKTVFGRYGLGEKVIEYMLEETGLFIGFYGNFDDVLMDENSPWFNNLNREKMLLEAIEKGLNVPVKCYGETHKVDLQNIFLGGKFPGFFGFDHKDLTLPGNRATIPQGQIYKNAGRVTTFSPSFRMIVEIDQEGMLTNIAGGPAGSRFSKWYKSDLTNWLQGVYKWLR